MMKLLILWATSFGVIASSFGVFAASFGTLASCAKNPVSKSAPKDRKEYAEELMEDKKFSEAQVELKSLLSEEPKNYEARSLLAACIAAQAGVSLVDILLKVASSKSEGDSATEVRNSADSGNSETWMTLGISATSESASGGEQEKLILQVLPSATLANVKTMRSANTQMGLIPTSSLTESMKTQASFFLLFETLLFFEYLRKNPSALASLSEADAQKALQNILKSASLLGGGAGQNPLAKLSQEQAAAVNNASGTNSKEKLAGLLGTTQ